MRGRRGDPYRPWSVGFTTRRDIDLDGDGRLDALVPQKSKAVKCSHDVVYKAYVMRGSCGHYVGDISGGTIDPATRLAAVGASGLKTVTTTDRITRRKHVRGAGQEQRGETTHFTWTSRYRNGRYQSKLQTRKSCCCIHCSVTDRCNGI